MQFSSQLIEEAVNAFAGLPGVGRKTALRLVLHLLQHPPENTASFTKALNDFRTGIKECNRCGNLSDLETCAICTDPSRDAHTICVVENIRDLMAIEDTQQYRGHYHVLGGVISPIEGIGPGDLNIAKLISRVKEGQIKEVIMAISPTIEGDTTIFYINKQLKDFPIKLSGIARGVSFGGELEYADGVTLGRSILARKALEN
ncbi:MAG: recombination mediator RecR [Bacteroidota bacterium]